MKTKNLIMELLVTSIFVSCSPTEIPISSTITPAPTAITIAPTKIPYILLQQDTDIFSGPSNADFDSIATLKTSDPVYPIGTFGDFIQVEANIDGKYVTGFVYKKTFKNLPSVLRELNPDTLPLKLMYSPDCYPGEYDLATNTMTLSNQNDDFFETETNAIKLDEPLIIKIGSLSGKGASFGSVKILGIPKEQDRWWEGITRMDITNKGGYYLLGIRNGTSENYKISWKLPIPISEPIQIVFEQLDGKSFILKNRGGIEMRFDLTPYLPDGLFPQGNVYFGTSVAPNSTLDLKGFSIGVLPNGKWVDQIENEEGLFEIAQKSNISIGTEFSLWKMMDIRYCQIMKKDFNVAVLSEFSSKWIWLSPGQYDFDYLDRTVDYAFQRGWRVQAFHLVWGSVEAPNVIPDWLRNGKFSRQEYIQILEGHVKTIVNRYKDKVTEWSIANEASSRSQLQGSDFWMDKIGPEYIEIAFRAAREADSDAVLIFNDFNNESARDKNTRYTVNTMYNTVKELKAKGVPIDVVGMQMHLLLFSPIPPEKADVIATMKKFGDLGLKIYITEFDVVVSNVPGTKEQKWAFEAKMYQEMLQACLESGVCTNFSTWGISDSDSWITCNDMPSCLNIPDANPLMFDRNYEPKPAYFAVRDLLLNYSMPSLNTP